MAPSPRMRLRSARLPDLDNTNPDPHPINAEAGPSVPSTPRKSKGGGGGSELRRVPSKSKLNLAVVGSRPRKASGRARREGTAGEESGNESEGAGGSARRGVLRSGTGSRGRGGRGGRVRFKGGRKWERMDVLLAILCTSSLLLLALFIFHLTRSSPITSSHSQVSPYQAAPPLAPPPPPPPTIPTPATPTIPQPPISMEDKVRLIAEELGVSPEDFVRSLQRLGGEGEEEGEEDEVDGWTGEL